METVRVEDVQDKLKKLIVNATTNQSKYLITSDEGSVVLLSEEAYENLLVTLEMLSTPILFESMHESHGN